MAGFKLALFHPFLQIKGGAEKCMLRIAERFDATVFCIHYDREGTFPGYGRIDVRPIKKQIPAWAKYVPKRLYEGFSAGSEFLNLKAGGEFDVFGASSSPSEWARKNNKPMVWYCHSPAREAYDLYEWRMQRRPVLQRPAFIASVHAFRQVEARIVPEIEHIFANSRAVQQRVRKYLKRESEVLYSGVEFGKYRSGPFEDYFFYPSRIVPEKRFELAIKGFKRFKEKYGKRNWKLVIAGSLLKEKQEHVEYYEHLVKLLGDDGEILLDIEDREIYELYAHCTAVVFTPINEDFGLMPVEAAASRKPCIATAEGGPLETIVDGKTGYLVRGEEELAERMHRVASDKGLAKKMGIEGRKFCHPRFNWDVYMKRYGEVCRELIAGESRR